MKLSLAAFAAVAVSTAAFAQTPIGQFTGTNQENFDSGGQVIFTQCMPAPGVFGGTAQMCTVNGNGCHTTSGWSFQCVIYPVSPGRLFGSAGGYVEFDFSAAPAYKFGGFFGSHSGYADANIDFYDANHTLINTLVANIPADCSWNWNGWDIPTGASFIAVTGLNPYGGAFVLMDDMEVDYTPSGGPGPVNYCTAGTTTNGCVPAIGGSGVASGSAGSGFTLSINGVEGAQSGLIFYGLSGQVAFPWGTSSSFMCVKSPLERTPVQNSGGTLGACDGLFTLDWNLYIASNPFALGNPFAGGETVVAQGWFRDPPSPKTTNLSNGVQFVVHP